MLARPPLDHAFGCRYATLEELHRRQAPGGEHRWLTPREQQVYARLRAGSRRATWLAGRMLAKRLIADYAAANRLELPTVDRARVEIDSGQLGQRLAPRIRIADQTLPWSLSISHSEHGVLVALADSPALCVGVDLVAPVRPGPGFSDLWFTPAERRWLCQSGDPRWPSILWAAKEAAYKAINEEERFYPRQIEILPDSAHTLHCTRPVPELTFHLARTRQNEIAVVALWRKDDCKLKIAN
jgi:4'-phosphopantetheinyl transferase EntD